MEPGGQQGELSHPTTRPQLQTPNGRDDDLDLGQKQPVLSYPNRRRKGFSPPAAKSPANGRLP